VKVGDLVKIKNSKWRSGIGLVLKVRRGELRSSVQVMLTSKGTSWFNINQCEVL
jgi:hypothetical protein